MNYVLRLTGAGSPGGTALSVADLAGNAAQCSHPQRKKSSSPLMRQVSRHQVYLVS